MSGISPDLSCFGCVREGFQESASKYACSDILVNNAGVSESTPFMRYTEERTSSSPLPLWGAFPASPAALLIPHPSSRSTA